MATPSFPTTTNELQSILLSLVSGARYGAKIRFPHALVMAALFRGPEQSATNLTRRVARLTWEHAKNLALFATTYKLVLALLKYLSREASCAKLEVLQVHLGWVLPMWRARKHSASIQQPPGYPEHPLHSFLAGSVGGYIIWGRYSSVNYQILLYLVSRVLVGLWKRSKIRLPDALDRQSFRLGSALVWGLVMYLFEDSPEVLHPSLKRSMEEIYRSGSTASLC